MISGFEQQILEHKYEKRILVNYIINAKYNKNVMKVC